MGQLPIVSGSEVSTPMSTVKLDPSAFREAALMKGKVAGALGDNIGGFFQQVSDNVQEMRNAKHIFDAHLTLNKTKDQFLSDIHTNPQLASDPKTWLPEYKQRMDQARQQIMDKHGLGPKVKRHLDMMTQNFQQDSTAKINTAALLRETADNKEAGILTATYAAQNDREDKAIAIYKSLNEIGAIGPKETAARIAQVPGIAAEAKALTAIKTNAITAPDVIKQFKELINPKKFLGIERTANEARNNAQSGYAEELSKMIDHNPDHTLEPKMLDGWRDAGKIDTEQYDRLNNRMKNYTTQKAKKQTDEFYLAMQRVRDTDWVTEPNPKKTVKDLRKLGLNWTNPELRFKLNEYIDRAIETTEKPIHETQVELMRETFKEKEEMGRMAKADFRAKYGHAMKQPNVEDERLDYAKAQWQYLDWAHSKAGMEATPEQATAERERLGFGRYSTVADVQASYKAGRIDRAMAKKILNNQFGIE